MSIDVLSLHRDLVAIPSVSHRETAAADFMEGFLRDHGADVTRIENNVFARHGGNGGVLFNSHLDTVPPGETWTRDPWDVTVENGRVYGLGSNDAKASVAAMCAAFLDAAGRNDPNPCAVLFVPEEETGGRGAELAWPALRERGFAPGGVVVGEPTDLNIASAQKGLLILKLTAYGTECHSANAAAMGAKNPIFTLGRDLAALDGIRLGPEHPLLGSTTLQATQLSGGDARNRVPAEASCYLDIRSVPGLSHKEMTAAIRGRVSSTVHVHSDRLEPTSCPEGAAVLAAAVEARPEARVYGSRSMSDQVFFREAPCIKVGPGRTERSHGADEYVLESEILDGAAFYAELLRRFAGRAADLGAAA